MVLGPTPRHAPSPAGQRPERLGVPQPVCPDGAQRSHHGPQGHRAPCPPQSPRSRREGDWLRTSFRTRFPRTALGTPSSGHPGAFAGAAPADRAAPPWTSTRLDPPLRQASLSRSPRRGGLPWSPCWNQLPPSSPVPSPARLVPDVLFAAPLCALCLVPTAHRAVQPGEVQQHAPSSKGDPLPVPGRVPPVRVSGDFRTHCRGRQLPPSLRASGRPPWHPCWAGPTSPGTCTLPSLPVVARVRVSPVGWPLVS